MMNKLANRSSCFFVADAGSKRKSPSGFKLARQESAKHLLAVSRSGTVLTNFRNSLSVPPLFRKILSCQNNYAKLSTVF